MHPERDEDVEVQLERGRVYVQVKTRAEELVPSDISDALERFAKIRQAHLCGARGGTAQFYIVSNAKPSASLATNMADAEWPSDVTVLWPSESLGRPDFLPPALPGIPDLAAWCAKVADSLPFAVLSGSSLVWKLAAIAQCASAGEQPYSEHEFTVSDLHRLFEQIVVQLQPLPEAPEFYLPQIAEPDLTDVRSVRLVAGHPGAGKTAWAAVAAQHSAVPFAYFDASGVGGTALGPTLSRELAGRFLQNDGHGLGNVLIPGRTGLDALRAVALELQRRFGRIVVVLDNSHEVPARDLASALAAARSINWVLLSREVPALRELELTLDVSAERLGGWSTGTIAAHCRAVGCPVDTATCERVHELSGGLPLHVIQMVGLAEKAYAGHLGKLCDDLAAETNGVASSQQVLVPRMISELSNNARRAAAVLTLSEVPLASDEANRVLGITLGLGPSEMGSAMRELSSWGVIQHMRDGKLCVHQVVRAAASAVLPSVSTECMERARELLAQEILGSLQGRWDPARQRFYLHLLVQTRQIKELLDLATNESEAFGEFGYVTDVKPELEGVAASQEYDTSDRFWAADTLAFWAYQAGDMVEFERYLRQLEEFIAGAGTAKREAFALALKQIWECGITGDLRRAHELSLRATSELADEPELLRILRYNTAAVLYRLESYEPAAESAFALAMDYYDVLGLDLADVLARNPDEIWAKVDRVAAERGDLKRLADCLDLYAMASNRVGKRSGVARLHAVKFYTMSLSVMSAVRVGKDAVDEILEITRDPHEARQFIESVLIPTVSDFKLVDEVIPVRAQHAVVLAYCGDPARALAEIVELRRFRTDDPALARELDNQEALVHAIASGDIRLAPRPSALPPGRPRSARAVFGRKVGRNEKCPCGSGKKYKHCCGSAR